MKYFKKTVAFLIILTVLLSSVSLNVNAQSIEYVPSYERYTYFMDNTYPLMLEEEKMYLMTLNACKDLDFWTGVASWVIDEDLDTDRCVEILANMATMMNYQLEESIMMQAEEDTKRIIEEFALDSIGVVTDLVGLDESYKNATDSILKNIPTAIDITSSALDLTVDSIDELNLLIHLLGDYSMQYDFLTSVAKYAEHKNMKEAAEMLLHANEQILDHKLNTFLNTSEGVSQFLAKDIFLDQVVEKMLEDPDNFIGDADLMVATALTGASKLYGQVTLAFDLTLLFGDAAFGTSNTYNRYNEMNAMQIIRNALIKSINLNTPDSESDYDAMNQNIRLLKMILYVDARGESCCYQWIRNEGRLADKFWDNDKELLDKNYNSAIHICEYRLAMLDQLYSEDSIEEEPEHNIVTKEDQSITTTQMIESETGLYCRWYIQGDFDKNGFTEIYAFVCDGSPHYTNGAVWLFSTERDCCLFWLSEGEGDLLLDLLKWLPDQYAAKTIQFANYLFEILADL